MDIKWMDVLPLTKGIELPAFFLYEKETNYTSTERLNGSGWCVKPVVMFFLSFL